MSRYRLGRRFSLPDFRLFVVETIPRWRALEPELLAAGLSYFALFSLAPLLLVVLTLSRRLLSNPQAQNLILDRLSVWLSDDAATAIQTWMNVAAPPHSQRTAFIGLVISAIAGSQVLGYMKRILNRIWETIPSKKIPAWKDWLFYWLLNLAMLAALGLFLILSLVLDTVAAAAWKIFRDIVPAAILHSASWLQGINFGVSLFCFCMLFAVIYRLVPDTSMAWEDVWAGALLTSILLAIGKVGVSLYVNYAAFASAYGAASSVFVLLLSIYIGANIFIFGGVFTRAYSEHYGSRRHVHAARK